MTQIWKALGFVFVGIGIVGYVTPVLPGTIFLIIALYCFRKASNQGWISWMLENRFFGPTLRNWDEERSVTMRTKIVATVVMIAFITFSILRLPLWAQCVTAGLGVIGLVYLWTRKTKAVTDNKPGLPIVA